MAPSVALCLAVLAVAVTSGTAQGRPGTSPLADAFVRALGPALPYPAAGPDGTPESGDPDVVWTVRWPQTDEWRIEVLANPINPGNRDRALEAEKLIQASAMRAQQRSQGDYDRAVSDFALTGRISEIREISLRDDGVAGERYDAESQLVVELVPIDDAYAASLPGTVPPEEVTPAPAGSTALVRMAAHQYEEEALDGLPGVARYAAEQGWVFLGAITPPSVRQVSETLAELTVGAVGGGGGAVVVRVSGNRTLVEQVVTRANWAALAAVLKG